MSLLDDVIAPVYWMTAAGIYLAWSFLTNDWSFSWVIWPIAGVVFGIVAVIVNAITAKQDNSEDK